MIVYEGFVNRTLRRVVLDNAWTIEKPKLKFHTIYEAYFITIPVWISKNCTQRKMHPYNSTSGKEKACIGRININLCTSKKITK